jgi:hypothetical protein
VLPSFAFYNKKTDMTPLSGKEAQRSFTRQLAQRPAFHVASFTEA